MPFNSLPCSSSGKVIDKITLYIEYELRSYVDGMVESTGYLAFCVESFDLSSDCMADKRD